MNLHLSSDGPNLVELQIEDGALVFVRHDTSSRRAPAIARSAGMSRLPGMLAAAVFCALSAGAGYTMAPRAAGTAPRLAALAPRALAAMPSGVALATPRPYSDLQEPPTAEQHATQVPGSVPAAVMQHLSQRPVVTPPPAAQPAAPVPPAQAAVHGPSAGNAFGLE